MSSSVERLVESWLDKQTERRYQGAFVQLLISEGYEVLHNTRHSPIEFGKDVIARGPDGILYCFQLKGNPGGRITKSEAQHLIPQVVELIDIPPPPGFLVDSDERFVAILVTNGEVDEEARLLLDGAGSRTAKASCPSKSFRIWARGRLLSAFLQKAGSIWPVTLEGLRILLDMLGGDPRENPDIEGLFALMCGAVPINTTASDAAKDAAVSSLLLLCEIVKSRWYSADNHVALFFVSVIGCIYSLPIVGDNKNRLRMVQDYAQGSLVHCAELLTEALANGYQPDINWAQNDPLAEIDIMKERRRLMAICASAVIISEFSLEEKSRNIAISIIKATFGRPEFWGLGMIPSLILNYWAIYRTDPTNMSEEGLAKHLSNVTRKNSGRYNEIQPLASPYYGFIDCWAAKEKIRYIANDSINDDSFSGHICFAEPMMYILAKRNYKAACRRPWHVYSLCVHEEPELPDHLFFLGLHSREGELKQRTLRSGSWNELVKQAVVLSRPGFLKGFASIDWLIAVYISIVPFRASPKVIMWLDGQLCSSYYHEDFLPPEDQ